MTFNFSGTPDLFPGKQPSRTALPSAIAFAKAGHPGKPHAPQLTLQCCLNQFNSWILFDGEFCGGESEEDAGTYSKNRH
jgi:hypothetical protein